VTAPTGELSPAVAEQLARVEASTDGVCEYRPCRVTLRGGETLDRVYVVEREGYLRAWGVLPEDDPGKEAVSPSDVVAVEPSEVRLPAPLATKLYAAGESGMGYVIFTVVLADGRRVPCVTGNAVDFPAYPDGVTVADVVDVVAHEGRERLGARGASSARVRYAWCVYHARGA